MVELAAAARRGSAPSARRPAGRSTRCCPTGWAPGSIRLLRRLDRPALAARVPFALLLALTLAATWYAIYYLARTDAAQPVPFAFGGEASPIDYARAMADGALLALIACLGLPQLATRPRPRWRSCACVALCFYAHGGARRIRRWRPSLAVLAGLPALAASGAPAHGGAVRRGRRCW